MESPGVESWVEEQSLPRRAFYVACRSESLTARPLARRILDQAVVLYRAGGNAVAFVDRCPHRNVPLSAGTTSADGCLTCPYHGWRFDCEGQLVSIPGRLRPIERAHGLQRLDVREENGLVWVCPTPSGALLAPYQPPHGGERGYTTVVREVMAPGAMFDVAENALDVPHTAILHGGLFRKDRSRTRVRGLVRRYGHWVETQYVGEQPPRGLVAQLLAVGTRPGEARVDHFDRFFLPSVLQVEYRLGDKAHFVITGLLTPEARHRTRLYAVASFRTPLPGWLLALLLEPLGRLIFAQDQRMLGLQAESWRRFGGAAYVSTELDTMGPQMRRLLRNQVRVEAAEGEGRAAGADPSARAAPTRVSSAGEQLPVFESEIEMDA